MAERIFRKHIVLMAGANAAVLMAAHWAPRHLVHRAFGPETVHQGAAARGVVTNADGRRGKAASRAWAAILSGLAMVSRRFP